jgi:4,5-DOPA dioxygenase extradiol
VNRRTFLPSLLSFMSFSALSQRLLALPSSPSPMPVLFMGHGSPMNAIEENAESQTWEKLGKELPAPRAILCISAHWETAGTRITALAQPPTLHDFGGFPPELFAVRYPAPGDPELAEAIREQLKPVVPAEADHERGFDHGVWSVIRQMYPDARIPVVQLSLNTRFSPTQHFELGRELRLLRRRGVLIIGSGNLVHNLSMLQFGMPRSGFDWAGAANERIKNALRHGDDAALMDYTRLGKEARLAIPSPEHYLPLLYILGLREPGEQPAFFNDVLQLGSVSMTSVSYGFNP